MKSYLLSIILISILLLLPSCRNVRENGLFGRRSLKKAYLWAQQDSIRVADSLKSTLIVRDVAEDDMHYGEGIRNQYHIITGTFSMDKNAKLVAEQFQSQGYQTSIIRRTDSYGNILNMVSVKTFNNYEEALRYKNEFRSKVNSSAWLYEIK